MSDCTVTFLGTGSARPTPRRGCASVYLQLGADAVLLDCGEGTQLKLAYAGVRASRLAAICITHFHGDHINGLPGFLGTMGLNGHSEPLILAGPRGMDRYLAVLDQLGILKPGFPIDLRSNEGPVVIEGDGWRLLSCKLRHRVRTFGFLLVEDERPGRFDLQRAIELGVPPGPSFGVLQRGGSVTTPSGTVVHGHEVVGPTRPGRRIAYISDTRPSPEVTAFVAGADLLIHEATYTDPLQTQAAQRGHSTAREAAEIARDAGVRRLALTHLSSKYARPHDHLAEARAIFSNTIVAEDLLQLTVPRADEPELPPARVRPVEDPPADGEEPRPASGSSACIDG